VEGRCPNEVARKFLAIIDFRTEGAVSADHRARQVGIRASGTKRSSL
jgi:hypothetical protein